MLTCTGCCEFEKYKKQETLRTDCKHLESTFFCLQWFPEHSCSPVFPQNQKPDENPTEMVTSHRSLHSHVGSSRTSIASLSRSSDGRSWTRKQCCKRRARKRQRKRQRNRPWKRAWRKPCKRAWRTMQSGPISAVACM